MFVFSALYIDSIVCFAVSLVCQEYPSCPRLTKILHVNALLRTRSRLKCLTTRNMILNNVLWFHILSVVSPTFAVILLTFRFFAFVTFVLTVVFFFCHHITHANIVMALCNKEIYEAFNIPTRCFNCNESLLDLILKYLY